MRCAPAVAIVVIGLSLGCSNFAAPGPPTPSAPAVSQTTPSALVVYKDPLTGISSSDVRDAQGHVVQFTTGGEIVWTADGTRLPGHFADGPGYHLSSNSNLPAEPSCQCWLVVRFGAADGERRAYLTADYIHFNPRTLVALEIVRDALIVSRTEVFPPGTYTLSGSVTEATATGPMAIANVIVYRLDEEGSGWDEAKTDDSGFYQIRGLTDGSRLIGFSKDGYQKFEQADLPVHGDTRFDIQLVRR